MKRFYTFIAAVFWSATAFAQGANLLVENFSSTSYNLNFSTKGNNWSIENSSPNTLDGSSGGNYLATANGNGTRTITSNSLRPNTNNKLTITWYERKTSADVITRSFTYRVVEDGVFFPLIETSEAVAIGWTKKTATIHDDYLTGKEIELLWSVNRTNGSSAHYYIDDVLVTAGWEPVSSAPLPVELSSFGGFAQNSSASLNWTTATETDNEKFIVERSKDGKKFTPIGQVKGNGTSFTKSSYNFTDKSPLSGTNYYRLRQVDFDGTVAYSNIVALDVAAKGGLEAVVYPTVASRTLTISLQHASADAAISVVDATGRVVAQLAGVAAREIELPVHSFRNGVYYVKITDGLNQKVQRFIKE